MDPQTANSLAAHGFTASYTVEMPTYSTSIVGSVLLIAVTGSGAATVEHTLNGVIGARAQQSGRPAVRRPRG